MVCPECGKKLPDNAVKCNKCGKVFREVKKNSETDEYLKKQKQKDEERAKKIREKNAKKSEENPTGNERRKKLKKVIILCAVIAVIAAVSAAVFISVKNKKEAELKADFPELFVEYTYPEIADSEAVMKLGKINISAEEYEFFFRQSFSNVQNNAQLQFRQFVIDKLGNQYDDSKNYYDEYYEEYAKDRHNIFDFSKPINSQSEPALDENGNEISWQEFIRADAIKTMANYRAKFDLAQADGMELTDYIRYQVYSHAEGLRDAIKGSGYQNLKQYLQILFGSGCDEEFFRNELIREYTASAYDAESNQKILDSYSDKEISGEYKKDRANYDFIDLSLYEVTGKDALKKAEKILKDTQNHDGFTAAIQKHTDNTQDKNFMPAVPKQYIDTQFSEKIGEWAYDTQRKANDKKIFETANGFTVAVIGAPAYTKTDSVSYREIVISKTDDSGNMLSEDAIAAAGADAQTIYDEWKNDKPTEGSFAYTAIKKSQGSTASAGGLVPMANADDCAEQLGSWLKDKSRKKGDTQLIETDTSFTIVYFLKNYGDYWNYAIRAARAAEDTANSFIKAQENYSESFTPDILAAQEEKIITEINRIYFGIGM